MEPPPETDVSDDEVEKRERELESGEVVVISHEEFFRRIQQEADKGGLSPVRSAGRFKNSAPL